MRHGSSNVDPAAGAARWFRPIRVHPGRSGPSPRSAYQRAKILAVDDNVVVAALLAITLKSSGHSVTSVFNGKDAVAKLQMEAFDIVVLDLHLPDFSGFEVLEIVRARRLCAETPIVVVSSSDEVYDVYRARQLGAAGYFAKVVSPETLPDKIERILTGRDITWIDDYHCVADAEAPPLHRLPTDDELWGGAANESGSRVIRFRPQTGRPADACPRPTGGLVR